MYPKKLKEEPQITKIKVNKRESLYFKLKPWYSEVVIVTYNFRLSCLRCATAQIAAWCYRTGSKVL